MTNIIKLTDSYKVSHARQYPPGTERIFSFFESRGGRFTTVTFFGLQYLIKKYLVGQVVTHSKIAEARDYFAKHFGNASHFNETGWRHILDKWGGVLPVEIKAVPEGTTVPTGNVLMTIENLDPEVPWLTNYLETLLSQVWYPSTVATQSREMKKLIARALAETGTPELIDFKLHDFGFRGSTSVESAGIGGAAHLVNFMGTDTLAAIDLIADYYHEEMAGFSIPAAEHSTITSWGEAGEEAAYENMLAQYPTGLVAVVSDSYNVFAACEKLWGDKLRDKVLGRDGTLVVRPDSGYPPEVVVKVLEILGTAFGFTVNSKGFKVLNPKVRVIQGDGIDYDMLGTVLEAMKQGGWSADNIAFGSGGGLLQKVNRDTQKFAFKCSAALVGDTWRDVMKNPVTDPGKKSKAGRLMLVLDHSGYRTVTDDCPLFNELQTVFVVGKLMKDQTFADIRARAAL